MKRKLTLLEQIIVGLSEIEKNNKNKKHVERKIIRNCIACNRPIYNTNPKDDEEIRFTIIKNSLVSKNGKGFCVFGNFKSHSCLVDKPTRWTAELFIKETLEKIENEKV